ncbi:hypothetical protein MIDIC_170040 [Alphaproteobacteria bacterium]
MFGDTGYIKKELFEELYSGGLKLVTGIKKGMKDVLIPLFEKNFTSKALNRRNRFCSTQGQTRA